MGLQKYKEKRKFDRTPEPEGSVTKGNTHRFVVQRHDARRLHYDLRLELDGVLKSWAVPKGPSMNPKDKRLAVHTEDHPVEYLDFEGTIPKGNYGAGQMDIWDTGIFSFYENENDKDALKDLEAGNLKIDFDGAKLKGKFALVRTNFTTKADQWLLIKKKDELSIDSEYLPDKTKASKKTQKAHERKFDIDPEIFIKPMLATATKKIFDDKNWIFEIKLDGYRMISHIIEGKVCMYSRRGQNFNGKFSELLPELESISHDVILDGEVVLLDKKGKPHFQLLQNYDQTTIGELRYYVFDMLYLNGHDMTSLPLLERKSLIPVVITGLDQILYCDHVVENGKSLYKKLIAEGMEGVIAKKADAAYFPGIRSETWLKIKAVESMEALICGYTDSVTGGAIFGSLILGVYQEDTLTYIGNCGSGFSNTEQKELLDKFRDLATSNSPFNKKLNLKGRNPNWVLPKLVCEVKYAEITSFGVLRHPIYKGLRPDKIAIELKEETMDKTENIKQTSSNIKVDGHEVSFSNLDKIYWPTLGLKKYDIIDYYQSMADTILKYQKDRPQNLHCHPNGISGESFYQKDMENIPKWAETTAIYSESSNRNIDYLLCQNEATLLYMANLGCIEINPWNARIDNLENPDYGIIDIDPSEGNTFEEVIEVAQVAREMLIEAKVDAYCKTSGSSGLHIYIPLGAKYDHETCRDFVKFNCYMIMEKLPKLTSMERTIKNRKGKIYLDYLQNRHGQTVASAYSLRPKPDAPVSAPLHWNEVKTGLKIKDFNISNMKERIEQEGDLFEPVLGKSIDMQESLKLLENKK